MTLGMQAVWFTMHGAWDLPSAEVFENSGRHHVIIKGTKYGGIRLPRA